MAARLEYLRPGVYLYVHADRRSSNTYVVEGREGRALVVDPGMPDAFPDLLGMLGEYEEVDVVHTHFHYDHVAATRTLREVLEKAGKEVRVLHHERGIGALERGDAVATLATLFGGLLSPIKVDVALGEGRYEIGGLELEVVHTPGHTEDSICLVYEDVVFTGDLLFSDGSVGRVDLPTGNLYALVLSLERIGELGERLVAPGHGPPGVLDLSKVREGLMLF